MEEQKFGKVVYSKFYLEERKSTRNYDLDVILLKAAVMNDSTINKYKIILNYTVMKYSIREHIFSDI